MARKRNAISAVLMAIALMVGACAGWSHHRSEIERRLIQKSELRYAASLADYARDIKPGMLRMEVESGLTRQRVSFFQRSGDRSYNTWIPLGREPSGVWYCGPVLVGAAVSYEPKTDESFKGEPADVVHSVTLDHWWDDCM